MKAIVTLMLLTFCLPALAGHGHGHGAKMDTMAEELQLNEEQRQSVRQIMEEQHEAWRELFRSDAAPEEKKAQMEALHEQAKEKFATVLNAEQMARLETMMERRRSHRFDSGERMEKLGEKLDLNDEQAQAVRKIMEEQRDKMRSLFTAEGDREEKRAKMEALRAETHEKLAAVLSEEQLARMEELHKKHHDFHHRRDRQDGADE